MTERLDIQKRQRMLEKLIEESAYRGKALEQIVQIAREQMDAVKQLERKINAVKRGLDREFMRRESAIETVTADIQSLYQQMTELREWGKKTEEWSQGLRTNWLDLVGEVVKLKQRIEHPEGTPDETQLVAIPHPRTNS